MDFQFKDLIGYKIQAQDGQIGSVHDILFDDESWDVRYIVVDTGGWLLGRKVLIAPLVVSLPDETEEILPVSLTKDEVKDSPEVPIDPPLSREEEALYRDHFKWPYYWGDANAFDRAAMSSVSPEAVALGTVAPIGAPEPPIPEAPSDPMLRSARHVKGYSVRSGSEDIGEVIDYIVDSDEWDIRHITVKLSEGAVVLVPIQRIKKVGWREDVIELNVDPRVVTSAPAYDESRRGDRDYIEGVGTHYDRSVH